MQDRANLHGAPWSNPSTPFGTISLRISGCHKPIESPVPLPLHKQKVSWAFAVSVASSTSPDSLGSLPPLCCDLGRRKEALMAIDCAPIADAAISEGVSAMIGCFEWRV